MLKKGSVLLLFVFILLECTNREEHSAIKTWQSYKNSNFIKYQDLYHAANDSIDKWHKDSLEVVKSSIIGQHQLDSVWIFNKDSTRFFTTYNIQNTSFRDAVFDNIDDFGGAKINGKWYFFLMGVSAAQTRSYWQDSAYKPLTFYELSYVAYKLRFENFIKNINEGNLKKNEAIFDNMFHTIDCKDSINKIPCRNEFLIKIEEKYKYKISAMDISEWKKIAAESKTPPEPEKPFWDFIFGNDPLFESKAWKEFINNK